MFTSSHGSIQIVAPERRYLQLLIEWYDGLDDSEAKLAVRRVKWRELKPPQRYFKIAVQTEHPFPEDVVRLAKAREGNDEEVIGEAADQMLRKYGQWLESHLVPHAADVDERPATVSWMPQEIPLYDPDDLPAQERAQLELNTQAESSLSLVKSATCSISALVKSQVGTNIPFVSAGFLAKGILRPIRMFPEGFPETEREVELLGERITEHASDYVALVRLASHFDCGLSLVTQTAAVLEKFTRDYSSKVSGWMELCALTEAEDFDFLDSEPLMSRDDYATLEEACDGLRQVVTGVANGRKEEVSQVINHVLIELPVPDSPFKGELEDGADWWKTK